VPLVIGTLFLSEGIINLIGGAAFAEAANTLRILIFALAFIFFGGFFNNILIASNNQKKMLWMLISCAVFNVVANIIFIPHYSYTASAIISTLTEFFVATTGLILTIKFTGYKPSVKQLPRILFSGIFMIAFLFLFKSHGFLPLVIESSAVYLLLLWLTKTITIRELRSIFSSK
jgi:O-antigen/teichoic acid export membrane protein